MIQPREIVKFLKCLQRAYNSAKVTQQAVEQAGNGSEQVAETATAGDSATAAGKADAVGIDGDAEVDDTIRVHKIDLEKAEIEQTAVDIMCIREGEFLATEILCLKVLHKRRVLW